VRNIKPSYMTDTAKKNIGLSAKDFIGVCLFLISLGISIGGFLKVIADFDKLDTRIEKLSDDITTIKVQNAEIKGDIKAISQKK
jgi:hypothetical protein